MSGYPFIRRKMSSAESTNRVSHAMRTLTSLLRMAVFWIEDGVLAVVDRWKWANHLVVVDVRSGIVRPKVQVRRIETVAVLDPARCEDAEHPE